MMNRCHLHLLPLLLLLLCAVQSPSSASWTLLSSNNNTSNLTFSSLSPRSSHCGVVLPTRAGLEAALLAEQTNTTIDWTNSSLLTQYEQLVVIGGYQAESETYLNDIVVSESTDGASWQIVSNSTHNPAPFSSRSGALLLRTQPHNRTSTSLLLIGGLTTSSQYLSDIWQTHDPDFSFTSWILLSDQAEFGGRAYACGVAWDEGKTIVVWGGLTSNSAGGGDAGTWLSTNSGKNFTLQPSQNQNSASSTSSWTPRYGAACTSVMNENLAEDDSFTETLWMVGGELVQEKRTTDEIWYSRNRGMTWILYDALPSSSSFQHRAFSASTFGILVSWAQMTLTSVDGSDASGVSASLMVPYYNASSPPTLVIYGGETIDANLTKTMLNDTIVAYFFATNSSRHTWSSLPTASTSSSSSSSSSTRGRSSHLLLINSIGRLFSIGGNVVETNGSATDTNTSITITTTGDVLRYNLDPSSSLTPPTEGAPSSPTHTPIPDSPPPKANRTLLIIVGILLSILFIGLGSYACYKICKRGGISFGMESEYEEGVRGGRIRSSSQSMTMANNNNNHAGAGHHANVTPTNQQQPPAVELAFAPMYDEADGEQPRPHSRQGA